MYFSYCGMVFVFAVDTVLGELVCRNYAMRMRVFFFNLSPLLYIFSANQTRYGTESASTGEQRSMSVFKT